MPVDIDFQRIRPHGGRRDFGFEELCCQLARLEPCPGGSQFYRKGAGGDAGVECYLIRPDGSEAGWQAKYFFEFGSSQTGQLDESIEAALAKHPRLDTYHVCLPIDLRDSRAGKGLTELGRWEKWREKWLDRAAQAARSLTIVLWSRSALVARMSSGDRLAAGRLSFWFGQMMFSSDWFWQRFKVASAALGRRYSPETNVELPIRRQIRIFARSPDLSATVIEHRRKVLRRHAWALRNVRAIAGTASLELIAMLESQVNALVVALKAVTTTPLEAQLPLDACDDACEQALRTVHETLRWLDSLPGPEAALREHERRVDDARAHVYELASAIRACRNLLTEGGAALANERKLLLHGAAGSGKSHLMADAVAQQLSSGGPAVLLLGNAMVDDDTWRQVLEQLDLRGSTTGEFLGALDAAAEAANVRALLMIDAINERHGLHVWPARLAAFLAEAAYYPRVVVVLSCRSTYLPAFEDALASVGMPRLEHEGFAGTDGEAAAQYLEHRGIVRPGAPSFNPEFDNPLFLRTCCDLLERQGTKIFPRGLRGVTAVFGFYIDAATSAVEQRMRLDPRQRIVRRALDALTDALPATGALSWQEALEAMEHILPSGGSADRSLLLQLEHEGVITVELAGRDGEEVVRFTFERLSDHHTADRLLTKHLDPADGAVSFTHGRPLGDLLHDRKAWRRAGVIEALAVQLPERAGLELPDVWGWPQEGGHLAERAFLESLLWRKQACFTRRTFDLLRAISDRRREDLVLPTLIAVATEPDNAFNVDFLDARLRRFTLPQRDAAWSAPVAEGCQDDSHPAWTLVSWARRAGFGEIENRRAELAAMQLAWLLSSSDRRLRDRATKALVALLAPRLHLAAEIVERFVGVDDPYIVERVFAAVYGAAMQGLDPGSLGPLAERVHASFFANGMPLPHLLARDHARGVVELAAQRGQLPVEVALAGVRPPYRSKWPIEPASVESVEQYVETGRDGSSWPDSIASSSVHDGDFARYVVDGRVENWGASSVASTEPQDRRAQHRLWLNRFRMNSSAEQRSAYLLLRRTVMALRASGASWGPERDAAKSIEQAFLTLLSIEGREDYRINGCQGVWGRDWIRGHGDSKPIRFNSGWARRWICCRAHELGWTTDRFLHFDRHVARDTGRHSHRLERNGKKYQWIALNELLARLADNCIFFGNSYGEDPITYEGPWQLYSRDLDPSLLLASTANNVWDETAPTWWSPKGAHLRSVPPDERLAWLDTADDELNEEALITVSDPEGRSWLVVDAHAAWRQKSEDDEDSTLERETWYRIDCLVLRKDDEDLLWSELSGRTLVDPDSLPRHEALHKFFLGEYPWHPAVEADDGWMTGWGRSELTVPVRRPATKYFAECSGYDHSLDENVSVRLPAPWLMQGMGARLISGDQPRYVDAGGKVVFFDPSAFTRGPDAALVDRDRFLEMLEREGLSAVWVIAGEKNAYGRGKHSLDMTYGGRRLHTGLYRLGPTGLMRKQHVKRERPTPEQLAAFLGRPRVQADSTASPVAPAPGRVRRGSRARRAP